MKFSPLLFSPGQAWYCIVISVFAVVILGVISHLFRTGHESVVGGINDPPSEAIPAIVSTITAAIFVYLVCFHRNICLPQLRRPPLASLDKPSSPLTCDVL
ncbi:hypothetical protein SAPIO_CDS3211 [Scedosporium apiospermum]|uniref:Uncharacterized protein n=1 Tax=Pseudallescheria apiosperma TaxID=563466 RepID=A0A084GAA2_PSEDA|nr:uncharacterized protein SAPIO_CDS3211 [Scedosporium apiospermum]KEZ44264.1 hypothetical protein SAPIO_CDS3211 [Scedosporium apiospermum]